MISIAQANTTVLISMDTKRQLDMLLSATAELQSSIWKPRKMKTLSYVFRSSPMMGYTNLERGKKAGSKVSNPY